MSTLWDLTHWKIAVVKYARVKAQLQSVDREQIWEYYLPSIAAPEDEIAKTEQHLGTKFHQQFRSFLLVAGGWRSFWQAVDIWAPHEFVRGPSFEGIKARLSGGHFPRSFVDSVFPFAASNYDPDFFVMGREGSALFGSVVWLSEGREVERYESFQDFFLAMLEYSKRDLADLSRSQ